MSSSTTAIKLLDSEKLKTVRFRLEELNTELSRPETAQDTDLLRKIGKEHSEASQITQLADELQGSLAQLNQTEALMQDPEMSDLAAESN